METAVYETPVSGMTCRPCEDTILEALLATPGVLRAEVSYWKATVRITYDPALITADALSGLLTGIGYAPCSQTHGGLLTEALTAAAALAAAFLLPKLPLPAIPQVQRGASLLFLLLVGLITGTHCICMCGGIMLSQTAANDLQGRKRPVPHAFMRYQAGRLLISLLLGLIFGAAGQALTYGNLRRQLADSLEDKPFPPLPEALQRRTYFEFGSIEEHYKYRSAVMKAYPHGGFPVFTGYNHMQYQIRNPAGFAAMLRALMEQDTLTAPPPLKP